ncbi:MAG: hypothetical protein U0166_01630 [Acidobacteriota bacterium]
MLDLDAGDLPSARRGMDAAMDHLSAAGDLRAQAALSIDHAHLEILSGRLDLARDRLDHAEATLAGLEDRLELARACAERARLDRARGADPAPAIARARELIAGAGLGPESPIGRAIDSA